MSSTRSDSGFLLFHDGIHFSQPHLWKKQVFPHWNLVFSINGVGSLSSSHTQNTLPPRVPPPQQGLRGKGSLVWGLHLLGPGSPPGEVPAQKEGCPQSTALPCPHPSPEGPERRNQPTSQAETLTIQEQRHRALSRVAQPGFEPGSPCFQTPRKALPPGGNGREVA